MANATESLSLAESVSHLLEECRMVLPGVQALFGFQLIAVFNSAFAERLTETEQCLHLVALAMVAMSGALVMTPAAYHRQTAPREAPESLVILGGRLLLASMFPLMTGIGLDFYLIARLILGERDLAAVSAIGLVLFFAVCWFIWPRLAARRGR